MKHFADCHCKEVDWDVSDLIFVDTCNWRIDQSFKKIVNKWYGPVKILAKVEKSWEIELLAEWNKHPVFHTHFLCKYDANPFLSQVKPASAPIRHLPNKQEWEIAGIVSAKVYKC